MTSMFFAFLAKIGMALIALISMRIALAVFDKKVDVSFTNWINRMEEKHPDKLSLYYGLRMIAVAILFGLILS